MRFSLSALFSGLTRFGARLGVSTPPSCRSIFTVASRSWHSPTHASASRSDSNSTSAVVPCTSIMRMRCWISGSSMPPISSSSA